MPRRQEQPISSPRSEEERPSGTRLKADRKKARKIVQPKIEKEEEGTPFQSEFFMDTVRDLAKMFDDRIMRMEMDIGDRSRMNLAIWRMAKDQDFAMHMLNEALFFAKEQPIDKKLPLLKRLGLVSKEQLFQGLLKTLELSTEEQKGMEEVRRMDDAA